MTTWTIKLTRDGETVRQGRYADRAMAEMNARLIAEVTPNSSPEVEPYEQDSNE
jgi:hypothetical protein